jgi:hypothetical protein
VTLILTVAACPSGDDDGALPPSIDIDWLS